MRIRVCKVTIQMSMVAWWHGGMVAWWHGGMVMLWHGGMVAWWWGRDGGVAVAVPPQRPIAHSRTRPSRALSLAEHRRNVEGRLVAFLSMTCHLL